MFAVGKNLLQLFLFLTVLLSGGIFTSLAGQDTKLQQAGLQLLQDTQLRHASLSLHVQEVKTGRTLASINSERSLIPASLLKTVTTATALQVLGKDHRFSTVMGHTGTIIDGVLHGDLIVRAGGDPSLGAGRPEGAASLEELLAHWTQVVREAGISRIQGSVLIDESLQAGTLPSDYWQWNDIGNYYGAGAGSFIINENAFSLELQRGKQGSRPAILGVRPEFGPLTWINRLRCAGPRSGDQSYIFGAPGTYERVISGTIPAGNGIFRVRGSLPDPALQGAQWLQKALLEAGIPVSGVAAGSTQRLLPFVGLDTVYSPPLQLLAELTNYKSVNVFAEALYNALGRRWDTESPLRTGREVADYWQEQGIDLSGFEQVDGSGLSMRNLVTARSLSSILRRAALADTSYVHTLPKVGAQGTVRRLLRGKKHAGRIRAKSGTLKRARGFAGYATRPDGKLLTFVILVNNHQGSGSALRRKMGEWMLQLVR